MSESTDKDVVMAGLLRRTRECLSFVRAVGWGTGTTAYTMEDDNGMTLSISVTVMAVERTKPK